MFNMHASDVNTIEDLSRFFEYKSRDISEVFFNKLINISTICCRKLKDKQDKEISFKLQLSTIDKNVCDITQPELKSLTKEESKLIISQVHKVIKLFTTCLYKNKKFAVKVKVSKAIEELYNKYCDTVPKKDRTVEGFIRSDPHQILLQGITVRLRVNVKDINLSGLEQFEADLKEKLNQAQNTTNMQVVPVTESFGCGLTDSGKQVTQAPIVVGANSEKQLIRAPIVVEAMRSNFRWIKYWFLPSNLLNIIRYLDHQRIPKPYKQKPLAITYHQEPEEPKQDEVRGEENPAFEKNETNNAEGEKNNTEKPRLTQMEKNRTQKEHTSTKRRFTEMVKKFLEKIRIKRNPKKIHTTTGPTLTQVEENHTKSTHTIADYTLAQVEENHEENRGITAEPTLTEVGENQEEKEHIAVKPTFTQRVKKSVGIINNDDIQVQKIIKLAKSCAEIAMISNEIIANEKQKTFDEIFCEIVAPHYDSQDRILLFNTVFKTIFLKDIPAKDKISEEDILNILKKFGLEFNKEYLITQIYEKKGSLLSYVHCTKIPVISNSIVETILAPYEFIKQYIIIQKAQKKVREAIKNNNDKTQDEIFIEVMENYRDQDQKIFSCVSDKIFNSIFCGGKNPHEIETFEEVFNILKMLEVQFDAKYLKSRIIDKKRKLYDSAFSPKSQPSAQHETTPNKSINPSSSNMEENQTPYLLPAAKAKKAKTPPVTNTPFKSSLKTVFSSPEGYVCVFIIASSISILCLWHLPLGKVTILQGLVRKENRELAGLILNILLLALIVALVLNLIHYVYSEYKANNIGKKTPPVTNTPFKSSLNTVFSSKKGYLSLFAIASSISILCLWHLPLGEVPILQSLVPEETREFAGLILHILLITLIVLLILGLAYYIHSEYKAHNIGSVKEIDIENPIEESKFKEQELYL